MDLAKAIDIFESYNPGDFISNNEEYKEAREIVLNAAKRILLVEVLTEQFRQLLKI